MKEDLEISPGIFLRPASRDDASGITALVNAVLTADGDEAMLVTVEEMLDDWADPRFSLQQDAWVAEQLPGGRILGYAELFDYKNHTRLRADGYVHHDFMGLGIGTALLTEVEKRARQHLELCEPGYRVYIQNGIASGDSRARELHDLMGYQPVRYYWRMEITLAAEPLEAQLPVGVKIRPFDPQTELRQVFEADEEAFCDHWGHIPTDFEEWQHNMLGESYDPALWFVAWDGDRIAGASLCRMRGEIGWVRRLSVRRPWRKMGLGMALLTHSFSQFYQRGIRTIGLGVDASNPTGATRLYERAGMSVANEYVTYEKELRPGKEPQE